MSAHTLIIGGGLAGLAAAAALAQRGVRVTLLESRPRLGGRASSFADHETGTSIDNCQHVSLGCCTNFDRFLRTFGVQDLLREEQELYVIGRDGTQSTLRESLLPAPFHLWSSFRRLRHLSRRDRAGIARGLRDLVREFGNDGKEGEGGGIPRVGTFHEWLIEHGQSPAAIEGFWHVVLVSALSESLDRIDVLHAAKVFTDAFLAHRKGWRVQIPVVPLEILYGARMLDWFARHQAVLRLQSGVKRIDVADGRVAGVELANGERLQAEHYVLAVPFQRVAGLLPDATMQQPMLAGIAQLESAPISSVHLWYDRPITILPHAIFVGRLSQWLFNRTQLSGSGYTSAAGIGTLNAQGHYYQVVISASRQVKQQSSDETIAAVAKELADVFPIAAGARLEHARLVTEHQAVFSAVPGVDAHRPQQQSPLANLQLAGDWTRTGWPATMEGAVRSGYLAAENILAHLGRRESLLASELPRARLSKWIFGL